MLLSRRGTVVVFYVVALVDTCALPCFSNSSSSLPCYAATEVCCAGLCITASSCIGFPCYLDSECNPDKANGSALWCCNGQCDTGNCSDMTSVIVGSVVAVLGLVVSIAFVSCCCRRQDRSTTRRPSLTLNQQQPPPGSLSPHTDKYAFARGVQPSYQQNKISETSLCDIFDVQDPPPL